MESKRIFQLDNAKLFLIFCVVLGHIAKEFKSSYVLSGISFWIYMFHMPAFIFAAGLVSKSTVRNGRWRKVFPFLLLYCLIILLSFVRGWIVKGRIGPIAWRKFLYNDGVCWFAVSMFWWYAAAILMKKLPRPLVMAAALVLSLVSGYLKVSGSFLSTRRSIVLFPFFFAGYWIEPEKMFRILNRKRVRIAAAAVLAVSLAASLLLHEKIAFMYDIARSRFMYADTKGIPSVPLGWVYRSLFLVIASVLTVSVLAIMPSKKIPVVTLLGQRTMSVYVFHFFVFELILSMVPGVRTWIKMASAPHSICFAVFIVAFCSIRPLDWFVRKLMSVFSAKPARGAE